MRHVSINLLPPAALDGAHVAQDPIISVPPPAVDLLVVCYRRLRGAGGY